ncbi:PP7 [Orf virus]|uniref:PP7 n=1 Tax=Orf virus TaxID=10258 RepID=F1AXI2_ORFV|nr:PP7 [Orf virus]
MLSSGVVSSRSASAGSAPAASSRAQAGGLNTAARCSGVCSRALRAFTDTPAASSGRISEARQELPMAMLCSAVLSSRSVLAGSQPAATSVSMTLARVLKDSQW